MALRFTWDVVKAAGNRRKHRVSFETAARVFCDPHAWSEHDRVEGGEYRWQTIGSVAGIALLVAHTVEDQENGTEAIHIISARRATRAERRRYEEERYRHLRT